jgi:FkbM family methyltransferase
MSKFDLAIPDLFGAWCRDLALRYRFKYVLPRMDQATVSGIRLDFTPLSPRVRNRILCDYEEPERMICERLLVPKDGVLEIGSAIGFIGLFCQKKLGIQRYISVEPNPHSIEMLKRNYDLNGIVPVVWALALSDSSEVLHLDISGDFWGHCLTGGQKENTIAVQGMTLAEMLRRAGPGISTLIIDVEGAEKRINFAELTPDIRKIIIELHPRLIRRTGVAEIQDALGQQGFRLVQRVENTFGFLRVDSNHA